jgi:hypothetical protein
VCGGVAAFRGSQRKKSCSKREVTPAVRFSDSGPVLISFSIAYPVPAENLAIIFSAYICEIFLDKQRATNQYWGHSRAWFA